MDKSPHDEMKSYQGSFWNFGDKNAAEIEREIRITRADLDETVTALQARLAPQHMLDQFMDSVRDTIRDVAPRVADAIRRNPAPAGLIAIGLGWLFVQSVRPPRREVYGYGEPGYEPDFSATELSDEAGQVMSEVKGWTSSASQKIKDRTRQMKDKARDKASHFASATREKAGEWAESTREKAGQFAGYTREKASHLVDMTKERAAQVAGYTRDKAGEMLHSAGESMQHMGHEARVKLNQTGDATVRVIKENPLACALACLGIGAAVAISLPISRKEQQVLGPASDNLVAKAKQAGQETLQKVQNIAEAGSRAVQEQSSREGIV